jgi:hypothetical protein
MQAYAISIHGAQRKPVFLDLPGELRNVVYDLVFQYRTVNVRAGRYRDYPNGKTRDGLALLRVNRLIHAEALLLPYIRTTFAFTRTANIMAFLGRRTPEQVKVIESIQLTVIDGSRMFGERSVGMTTGVLRYLEHLSGLTQIELIEMSRFKPRDHYLSRSLERMCGMIRVWKPEIDITARDPEETWNLALNSSGDTSLSGR